ncbi:uncharacterized protein LOC122982278 [Thunnus albacares]|uniref:uncharacterized protein LOC122982278 n=1 Tax=Thunnus albacares TaxID=8236 RepID=UPI001CF6BC9C|nr:uncharacterized protein LOC122982278 [Thunnus albacares]
MRTFPNFNTFFMAMMRLGTALAFIAVVVSPMLLDGNTTCQIRNQSDYVEGKSPVKLTTKVLQGEFDSECVTVHVWIKAEDFNKTPKIEIQSQSIEIIRPTRKRGKKFIMLTQWYPLSFFSLKKIKSDVRGTPQSCCNIAIFFVFFKWELVHDCISTSARSTVTVSYITTSESYSVSYTVPDSTSIRTLLEGANTAFPKGPMPDFQLSVNQLSKSINVTVEPGDKEVNTRWCYKTHICDGDGTLITIDPTQSRSALLNIPHLLPCLCVQSYYTHPDAWRRTKCPFTNGSFTDVQDVWNSSDITWYESNFTWNTKCLASDLDISASLCWKQYEHLCTPVLNSTLEGKDNGVSTMTYDTSTVDKHPQMCVQFSLKGSHHIECPFEADMSSWEVYIELGQWSVFVYLTSSVPATFSAQLCVLNDRGCTPTAQVHSVRMEGNTTDKTRLNVALHSTPENPCVQVWQSDPARHGARILCPDYKHNRYGIYAVAALTFVVFVALLGIFIHRLTKNGAAGWLYIQKPVLLVGSSEQSEHVSAVCALASILQGELSATVHMALCAQSSQRQAGARTGVADLGPLPWLYGQWEAMRKAQGKVLIIWSPEAKKTYEKWREERANMDKNERTMEDDSKTKIREEVEEDSKLNGRRVGKCKKGKKDCVQLCDDDEDQYTHSKPSSVITPVFTAALACLEGALQECKDQGVALVYFHGLGHSRDIPKAFRGVPRYCLPQDFRGLLQELGGVRRQTKTGELRWHCWPRLLSKVLSVLLARQLAHRLQALLPQVQGKKMQGLSVIQSQKMMSENTQCRLKFPLAAKLAKPETIQEHEPLHGSPGREEQL